MPIISIIDDDESIRLALESLVCSLGFEVRTFSSAEEFLRSSDRHETVCLISDVQMPSMSGIELQQHLAADGDRTPIVFITAFANERIEAQVMQAGALGFLRKPFSANALIDGVHKALRQGTPTVN
jgi:FixJ family two-component response regulator